MSLQTQTTHTAIAAMHPPCKHTPDGRHVWKYTYLEMYDIKVPFFCDVCSMHINEYMDRQTNLVFGPRQYNPEAFTE